LKRKSDGNTWDAFSSWDGEKLMALLGREKERWDRRPSGDWERATCCLAKALLNLHHTLE